MGFVWSSSARRASTTYARTPKNQAAGVACCLAPNHTCMVKSSVERPSRTHQPMCLVVRLPEDLRPHRLGEGQQLQRGAGQQGPANPHASGVLDKDLLHACQRAGLRSAWIACGSAPEAVDSVRHLVFALHPARQVQHGSACSAIDDCNYPLTE